MIRLWNTLLVLTAMGLAGCCRFHAASETPDPIRDGVPVGRVFYRCGFDESSSDWVVSPEQKAVDAACHEIHRIGKELGFWWSGVALSGCMWIEAPAEKALEFHARIGRGVQETTVLRTMASLGRLELFQESEVRELISVAHDKKRLHEVFGKIIERRREPEI